MAKKKPKPSNDKHTRQLPKNPGAGDFPQEAPRPLDPTPPPPAASDKPKAAPTFGDLCLEPEAPTGKRPAQKTHTEIALPGLGAVKTQGEFSLDDDDPVTSAPPPAPKPKPGEWLETPGNSADEAIPGWLSGLEVAEGASFIEGGSSVEGPLDPLELPTFDGFGEQFGTDESVEFGGQAVAPAAKAPTPPAAPPIVAKPIKPAARTAPPPIAPPVAPVVPAAVMPEPAPAKMEFAVEIVAPTEARPGVALAFQVRVANRGTAAVGGLRLVVGVEETAATFEAGPFGLAAGETSETTVTLATATGPTSTLTAETRLHRDTLASATTSIRMTAPALAIRWLAAETSYADADVALGCELANDGTAAADDVVATIALPADVELGETDGVPDPEARRVAWIVPSLAAGDKRLLALVVRAPRPTETTFVAEALASDVAPVQAEQGVAFEIDPAKSSRILDQFVAAMEEETAAEEFDLTARRDAATGPTERHLVFSLGKTDYAIPAESIVEVGATPRITPVPNVPDWVRGVANIRGDIFSMVSLNEFLDVESDAAAATPRMLVVRNKPGDLSMGVLVDRIGGFCRLASKDLQRPDLGDVKVARFLNGIAEDSGRMLAVLDVERILTSEEMNSFAER